MNDNEILESDIKQGLKECCSVNGDCCLCPAYLPKTECINNLQKCAIDLINRLQAENKRLENTLDDVLDRRPLLVERSEKYAKAEAYKEFAEKLHEELRMYGIKDKFNKAVFLNVVDKAKKELVGTNFIQMFAGVEKLQPTSEKELVGEDNASFDKN